MPLTWRPLSLIVNEMLAAKKRPQPGGLGSRGGRFHAGQAFRRFPAETKLKPFCQVVCLEPDRLGLPSSGRDLWRFRIDMSDMTLDRTTWQIGQRVARKDTDELGTVTEKDPHIKVKWDGGRTSYFRYRQEANVQIITTEVKVFWKDRNDYE
jgi:hypothetical protein